MYDLLTRGRGRVYELCTYTFSRRLFAEVTTYDKKSGQIFEKNREKNRELIIIELMNLGGGDQSKCRSFLEGVVKSVRL